MKFEKIIGDRFKERPSDCVIDSHALMIRGGYMKYVANGIFSQYPPLKRVTRKIEEIIREEMDAIDGQEVLFPVVLPADLWEESGRYESIGSELMRMKDRNGSALVLGMTHEEAAVQLVREYGKTYAKYPFMIYQIQTKFRDEGRPRGGLIRVREFTMKDAYSFHTSQEDLESYYQECFDAYHKIFARAGVPEVISVASDSGMMGGKVAHEYMLLTPVGEDSLVICSACDYKANMEAAKSIIINDASASIEPLTLVHTPNYQSIEEVSGFLKVPMEQTCKAVVYQKNMTDEYVVIFIRGDLDVNETKIKNFIGEDIHPAVIDSESGLVAGYIGPVGLESQATLLFDESIKGIPSLVVGGNIVDYHYTGFNLERDYGTVDFGDFAKIKEGGICPQCHEHAITLSRGIEVGNIFQLGTKYSASMNMQYADSQGELHHPIMGCYGIGVGRLAASVCEAHHDDYGPIWPISIAPWEVQICCLRSDDEPTKACADALYESLQKAKVEVIYDDRQVRPGVMFSDADLLGVPVRVIVSPKNMAENVCEIVTRDKSVSKKVGIEDTYQAVIDLVTELKAALNK